jgi:hypothetical protein
MLLTQSPNKEDINLPACVAELTIHGTIHLTWNTNRCPASIARDSNSFFYQSIIQPK